MRTLEIIRNAAGLESLSEEWNALATQSRTPLLGYDWFASCVEAFYTDGDLRVAVVRAAGVLDAVAPLGFERTPFGRRLTILGASQLHEPSDWLFRSPDALQHLVEGVMKLRRPLILAAHSRGISTLPDAADSRAAPRGHDHQESVVVVGGAHTGNLGRGTSRDCRRALLGTSPAFAATRSGLTATSRSNGWLLHRKTWMASWNA